MTRVATADGYELHAEAHGDGAPIVISCALATTSENWRPQVAPLVDACMRVVLWDLRGHGRSDAPDDASAYTMPKVVDDLARVLDWAARSQLEPIKKVAKTLRAHLEGILRAQHYDATNASAESLNSLIQKAKYLARGFRNRERFRTAILFFRGGLNLYPLGSR